MYSSRRRENGDLRFMKARRACIAVWILRLVNALDDVGRGARCRELLRMWTGCMSRWGESSAGKEDFATSHFLSYHSSTQRLASQLAFSFIFDSDPCVRNCIVEPVRSGVEPASSHEQPAVGLPWQLTARKLHHTQQPLLDHRLVIEHSSRQSCHIAASVTCKSLRSSIARNSPQSYIQAASEMVSITWPPFTTAASMESELRAATASDKACLWERSQREVTF